MGRVELVSCAINSQDAMQAQDDVLVTKRCLRHGSGQDGMGERKHQQTWWLSTHFYFCKSPEWQRPAPSWTHLCCLSWRWPATGSLDHSPLSPCQFSLWTWARSRFPAKCGLRSDQWTSSATILQKNQARIPRKPVYHRKWWTIIRTCKFAPDCYNLRIFLPDLISNLHSNVNTVWKSYWRDQFGTEMIEVLW